MKEELSRVLEADQRVAYAVLFGSRARGTARPDSDVDVAVGLMEGARLTTLDLGGLIGDMAAATQHEVDLVLLDEASPALAYRVFRDGSEVYVRDRARLVERKARAIVEYLDFKPIEALCAAGVLAAASHGR